MFSYLSAIYFRGDSHFDTNTARCWKKSLPIVHGIRQLIHFHQNLSEFLAYKDILYLSPLIPSATPIAEALDFWIVFCILYFPWSRLRSNTLPWKTCSLHLQIQYRKNEKIIRNCFHENASSGSASIRFSEATGEIPESDNFKCDFWVLMSNFPEEWPPSAKETPKGIQKRSSLHFKFLRGVADLSMLTVNCTIMHTFSHTRLPETVFKEKRNVLHPMPELTITHFVS